MIADMRKRWFGPAWGPLTACVLFALLAAGCKDEVVPAKGSKERVLTIDAREVDPITGAKAGPAAFAEIVVYEVGAGGDKEIARFQTNDQGAYSFRSIWPASGTNIRVLGIYKNERQYADPPVFLFCNDMTVRLSFIGAPPVCCPNDTVVTYLFQDERQRTDLIQNLPDKVAEYTLTRTLFFFHCADPSQTLTVDIPAAPAPFRIKEVRVNDRVVTGTPIVLHDNEALTVLFGVSTANVGVFDKVLDFTVTCSDGASSVHHFRVDLAATVVEFTCTCPKDSSTIIEPDASSIEVNTVRTYSGLSVTSLPLECRAFTIQSIVSQDAERSWDIVSPLPGASIEPTAGLVLSARARPIRAGAIVDTFHILYKLANGTVCGARVVLQGLACRTMCPLLTKPVQQELSAAKPVTINWGIVPFSPNSSCSSTPAVTRTQELTLLIPDTSCCPTPAPVSITVTDPDPRKVNSRFLTVTGGSNLLLSRNSAQSLTVTFTAPTVSQFEELFKTGQRVRLGTVADSEFTIQIRISNSTCRDCQQLITVRALVGTFIRISNVITLYAYGQNTPKLPDPPVRKVCQIDCCGPNDPDVGHLINLLDQTTKIFPNPPDEGDFFVEVAQNDYTKVPPPQDPMLFRVPGSTFEKLVLYKTNYLERNFADVKTIINELQATLLANNAYFTQPSLPWNLPVLAGTSVRPKPGEVYIMFTQGSWTSTSTGDIIPCDAALIYIRKIFLGNEPNSFNDQSGIEYEVIYPVILY